ncbi:HlyD family type I secretion periplasmic adaptor subunit [Sphingomonas sp. CJ20]
MNQLVPISRQDNKLALTINQFQPAATAIDAEPEPRVARMTLWAMGALVVVGLLWAGFATLDRIVSARGKIVTAAPTIVVQPFESATIKSIDVKVGDVVKANTVLAHLDPTFALANIGQIQTKVDSLNATIARLEAEQAGRPYVIPAQGATPYQQLEHAIWLERRTKFAAQIASFQERMSAAQAGISARSRESSNFRARLALSREVEEMRNKLVDRGYGTKLNALAARDARINIESNLVASENSRIDTQHGLAALRAERDVFSRGWETEIVQEMVEKRNERDSLQEQLTKAQRIKDMVQLRTPVDAVVLEVAPRSVGSVINSAEPLFRLVPVDAKLEVEAAVEASQLSRVAVGDTVQIKLDAYPYQEHGMLTGKITTISGDSFTNERGSPDAPQGSFYRVRIAVGAGALRNVPTQFRMTPGMPLTAEIKIGKRSVLSYLTRPITRSVGEGMREP